jgi:hypothetical protein
MGICFEEMKSQTNNGFFLYTWEFPKRRHECCPAMSVAEMRILRWICGHTRRDRVRNEDIRDGVEVAPIDEKLVQHRLRWFGHV